MGIRELFLVALMPVLKTLFIAIVGLFLALDRVSILSAPARHHLNNVSGQICVLGIFAFHSCFLEVVL